MFNLQFIYLELFWIYVKSKMKLFGIYFVGFLDYGGGNWRYFGTLEIY